MLSCFAELHSLGHAHRDIKPHNVLLAMTSSGFPLVRICDVGSTRSVAPVCEASEWALVLQRLREEGRSTGEGDAFAEDSTTGALEYAATRDFPGSRAAVKEHATPFITARHYRAPELLCGATQYGAPVDIWALGVR